MKIEWPSFTFPPVNLWSFPKQYRDWWRMSDSMSEEWYVETYLPQQNGTYKEIKKQVTSWDYVRLDIANREEMGVLKYGKYLTSNTDEDMLNHLYNELLDAVVYIKTLMLQRDKPYDPNL